MGLMLSHRSGQKLGYVPNFWTLWSQRFEIVGEQQMQEVQLLFVFVHDPRWKGGTVLPGRQAKSKLHRDLLILHKSIGSANPDDKDSSTPVAVSFFARSISGVMRRGRTDDGSW